MDYDLNSDAWNSASVAYMLGFLGGTCRVRGRAKGMAEAIPG